MKSSSPGRLLQGCPLGLQIMCKGTEAILGHVQDSNGTLWLECDRQVCHLES